MPSTTIRDLVPFHVPLPEADHVIIQATVGSTAYGLAREGSDVDTLGVFVAPTEDFWRLTGPSETFHNTQSAGAEADYTLHEVGKYVRLALRCNPTLVELLWLDERLYQELDYWGERLVEIRSAFLSDKCVRDAFGGYALQQLTRLVRRNEEGKQGFSSDTQKRTAKHARHCFRLLRQGRELLETGKLVVEVENPEEYWAFDEMSVDEIAAKFTAEDMEFRAARSVLPDRPNSELVEYLLMEIRKAHL